MNLGGQEVDMHQFSNLVPMRQLTTGDLEEMALLAGQGVGLVRSVKPAGTVIAEITTQARTMLDQYRPRAAGWPGRRAGRIRASRSSAGAPAAHRHSVRSDTTGSRRPARCAGTTPNRIPTPADTPMPM